MADSRKIVVIGGGTGSFTVLRGLKGRVSLSAVVSMFDSGGSTGVLRDEFGVLPPGDVRRCLVALADEDSVLRKLFAYRFAEESSLRGHSFGNLFLTALAEIAGSEKEAIRQAERILHVKGRVLPVSLDHCQLCAELEDGTTVRGEANIDIPSHDPGLKITKVWLEPPAKANEAAVKAIEGADVVVIGPGDLFTSVVPNLLVKGIPEALERSGAKKVYVCNLMTKPGETSGFSASEHLRSVLAYGGKVDVMVCNSTEGSPGLLKKYAEKHQLPVKVDEEAIRNAGVELVCGDVMTAPELIRHDSEKLARLLLAL